MNTSKLRPVGSTVKLAGLGIGSLAMEGVITEVHEVPGHPHLAEYSVEWADGKYPGEIWSEQDFEPLP